MGEPRRPHGAGLLLLLLGRMPLRPLGLRLWTLQLRHMQTHVIKLVRRMVLKRLLPGLHGETHRWTVVR